MCGRYYVDDEETHFEMRKIISEASESLLYPLLSASLKTGEISPTNIVPILTANGAMPMKWGFPRWDNKGVVINARSETALEKQMFRKAMHTQRCIVPTSGFFEWKQIENQKKKSKYLFRLPQTQILYLAGIYNLYKDSDGTAIPCFVILTTAANDSMSHVHDRMPVILQNKDAWIREQSDFVDIMTEKMPELSCEQIS